MVYVFLANGFEEVEALVQVDMLRRCELDVKTVGIGGQVVRGAHGITVACDMTPDEMTLDGLQAIVLPGGMPGTLNLEQSEDVQKMLLCIGRNPHWSHLCRSVDFGTSGAVAE